jgi:hypothetical protein
VGIVHRRNKALSAAAGKWVELLHEEPEMFSGQAMKPRRNGADRTNGNGRRHRSLKKRAAR